MDLRQQVPITALLHYQDDYLNVAGLSLPVATKQLSIILNGFRYLGIPIATDKALGPSQVLPFLGVELDTVLFEARLPADKLREIKDLLQQLLGANHTTYGFLDTFLGKLSFASRVVVQSFSFRVSTAGAKRTNFTGPGPPFPWEDDYLKTCPVTRA